MRGGSGCWGRRSGADKETDEDAGRGLAGMDVNDSRDPDKAASPILFRLVSGERSSAWAEPVVVG